ncbi:MAG: hypothetical protein ABI681_09010 [Gemmatimonadales bacterium]
MKASQRIMVPVLFLIAIPATVSAQTPAAPPPEVHYITVTRFALPDDTLERRKVVMWIDSVVVPSTRLNPNVTSMKLATHNWGSDSRDVLTISEYPTWAAIDGDCKACDDWFTAHQPKAGTPRRAMWDAAGEAFRKALLGHHDEIYVYRVDRSKR